MPKEATASDTTSPLAKKVPKNPIFKRLAFILIPLLVLMLAVYLVADYIKKDVLKPDVTYGSVLHVNGDPFDGAFVSANGKLTATTPDGKFQIAAQETDTLTVSAFGYEPTTILASEIVATLNPLPLASARVVVVDPNYHELENALVVRLDPNSSAPLEERITESDGSALFLDILSGQAMFVVLHPDYGIGWVETALNPTGYVRPIVQLQPMAGKEVSILKPSFINPALAQESRTPQKSDPNAVQSRFDLVYEFGDAYQTGDNTFEVSLQVRTTVAASYNQDRLREYISQRRRLELESKAERGADYGYFTYDDHARIQQQLIEKGYISPVTTFKIIPKSTRTDFEIDKAFQYEYDYDTGKSHPIGATVDEIRQNLYEVHILGMDNAAEVIGFIDKLHTQAPNGQMQSLTGWSQFPAARDFIRQNGGKIKMELDFSNNCCSITNFEISSNNTVPNPITIQDTRNPEISYTFNPYISPLFGQFSGEVSPDITQLQQFKRDNPRLEFTATDGRRVSLLDIPVPDPNYAPADFMLGFFDNPGDARNQFSSHNSLYKERWQQYLGIKLHNWLLESETVATSMYDEIVAKMVHGRTWKQDIEAYYQGHDPFRRPTDTTSNQKSTTDGSNDAPDTTDDPSTGSDTGTNNSTSDPPKCGGFGTCSR